MIVTEKKSRLSHFDAIRGVTMFLVVYHHICGMAFPPNDSIYSALCLTFRMPLFFFITGFFVYASNYSGSLLKERLKNRVHCQLYPTIVVGVVYCLTCLNINPAEMWMDPLKGGYWFTFVAVELYCVGAIMLYCFDRHNVSLRKRLRLMAIVGCLGFCCSILADKYGLSNSSLWSFFNLYQVFYFVLFFMMGGYYELCIKMLCG